MLNIGNLVDNKYRIRKVIGKGGSSCVFLAEHIRLGNKWAIKEIYKNSAMNRNQAAISTELSILTKLSHPCLPAIIDVIETSDAFLLIMEYIEGISLDKVIEQNGPQSEENVKKWTVQICDVLKYLHSRTPAVIHRDIKPANIMLKPDGNIVLIDFGIAREFKRSSYKDTDYFGTHGYAAPEQLNGSGQTDSRTDIYSLGVTIYHLVTGCDPCSPPFGIKPIRNINAALSIELENIINKCTQLEPINRFQNEDEILHILNQIASSEMYFVDDYKDEKGSQGWVAALVAIPAVLIVVVLVVVILLSGNLDSVNSNYNPGDYTTTEIDNSKWFYLYTDVINQVYITSDEEYYYFFTPEKTGYYHFESSNNEDGAAVACLFDYDANIIESDNDASYYYDFSFDAYLIAGESYYFYTTLHEFDTGNIMNGYYVFDVTYNDYNY